jgi:hypothetical protein
LIGRSNVSAQAGLGRFRADLSATFGVAGSRIDGLFEIMTDPADVYMTLRIGELAGQPLERVTREYRAHRGQGWGVIAKNLGIKPGSEAFHALKQNRMSARSGGGRDSKSGKAKGKGKGKG